jgi:hypothetical protein
MHTWDDVYLFRRDMCSEGFPQVVLRLCDERMPDYIVQEQEMEEAGCGLEYGGLIPERSLQQSELTLSRCW